MNSETDDSIPEVDLISNINFGQVKEEVIAQGGGEGPADVSTLAVSQYFFCTVIFKYFFLCIYRFPKYHQTVKWHH